MNTTTAAAKDQFAAEAYAALKANNGNATLTAKQLDLARTTFRALITRHEANMAQAATEAPEAADEFDASRAEYDAATEGTPGDPVVAGIVAKMYHEDDAETDRLITEGGAEPFDPAAAAAETPEPAKRTRKGRQPKTAPEGKPCACRCGTIVNRTFVRGHDSVLLKKLRAAYSADDMTRDEVLAQAKAISARFHGKVAKSLGRVDQGIATPTENTRPCACGCGTQVNRTFARGHDSLHAKNLRAAYVAGKLDRREVLANAQVIGDRFVGKMVKQLANADAQAAAAAEKQQAAAAK
jgi:hypothetical protein